MGLEHRPGGELCALTAQGPRPWADSRLRLSADDAELVRDVFWDLFRQGFITLGLDDSNPQCDMTLARLVELAKLRWRIERDYQELKQEVGLGHFEGRGWRGFHHHTTLCIAAYGFLISERETIPPLRTTCRRALPSA